MKDYIKINILAKWATWCEEYQCDTYAEDARSYAELVVSKDLNAGAEDHKQDRQKLEKSLVLTQGLQQENECS